LRGTADGEVGLFHQDAGDLRVDPLAEGEALDATVDDQAEAAQAEGVVVAQCPFDRLAFEFGGGEQLADVRALGMLQPGAQPVVQQFADPLAMALRAQGFAGGLRVVAQELVDLAALALIAVR
jgi:hypothetical protein